MKVGKYNIEMNTRSNYFVAFWCTLIISLTLIIGGFILPPRGQIDPSVLTATGEIFLWPALAFAAKSLEEGKTAKIKKGDAEFTFGDNNNKEEGEE